MTEADTGPGTPRHNRNGPMNVRKGHKREFRSPANRHRYEHRTAGARIADRVTASFGSWPFIVGQSVIVLLWIGLNLVAWAGGWDPYPFILLNLVFSTQAAYAAPLLLLSQNRQAERDRIEAEHDFRVDQLALQYLFAWHRDAHGPDCDCVQKLGPAVDTVLARLADDVIAREATANP
ncbi:PROBABLE MEMBRANE PROTEIN [Amycolatopsis camponoti]|uniref:PROBABLE MEMBRANE PROTEIN n=1 Tax=Amycolatopsis camponoti TaxID=2606593 RepID=A0A6I8LXD2_9PSEU|nr:DUF1003 domain-containing protein [Amycolatopsis camponoti]VVJ21805.1 PROBABLE MEMBRANE PROTEIN [Amycolatopsis camponoti]